MLQPILCFASPSQIDNKANDSHAGNDDVDDDEAEEAAAAVGKARAEAI